MRYNKYMRVFIFIAFIRFIFVPQAFAERHVGFCDDVESTADIQNCIRDHHEAIQNALNDTYVALSSELQEQSDLLTALETSQKNWIEYRNSYCILESELSDNPALKRSKELSCYTILSSAREKLLSSLLPDQDQKTEPFEAGQNARWTNILDNEHNDIKWNKSDILSDDLTCDERDQFLIKGVRYTEADRSKIIEQPSRFNAEFILASVINKETGKPDITLLKLPVINQKMANSEIVAICDIGADVKVISPTNDNESNDENDSQPSCDKVIEISDSQCGTLRFSWVSDAGFSFIKPDKKEMGVDQKIIPPKKPIPNQE